MHPPRRLLPLAAAAALALAPPAARACGGLFCDLVNNQPVPVDQTGENILFVVDDVAGTVEAHIQIQYTGEPQKFAWIIPVTAIPEFSIGSEALFTNLLAATVPTYSFTAASDCADNSRGIDLCCACGDDGAALLDSAGWSGEEPTTTGGPEVVKREVVGAFELVVLSGGTAQELWDWLNTHGYYQDGEAAPIVEQYLAEKHYFVAAKLRHGAGVDEIQPLVLTYAGNTPCVPLRLTAIAAAPDMPIRVFALGDGRTVPSNFRHVEPNDARLDWQNGADNYFEVVGAAIDEAGGRGFVTEYAGSSGNVARDGISEPTWSATPFYGVGPILPDNTTVIDTLIGQGLMQCDYIADECVYNHPQLLPLLRTYLPAPPLVDEDVFYQCLLCYAAEIDMAAWDANAFATGISERIISPANHALSLLDRWPYLTRMLTILSPHEMTVDPEFTINHELLGVDNARTAVLNFPCEGSNAMDLPTRRRVVLDSAGAWPEFDASMPWAARVEQMAPSGAPQVITDNADRIDAALRASNARFEYDDGTRVRCSAGRGGPAGALTLALIFSLAWRGRRRRR